MNCINGQYILDAGCGDGALANRLSSLFTVTASDINISSELKRKYPKITFKEGNIESLPFNDNEFDTVICSHTLEHSRNISQAISELRRVTKKRLIIITPKQRPYKYTFDLHLHFFPYEHSLLALMGTNRKNSCRVVGGDLFYIEDI
jgi:ubiquinone/menaquinone biosynthesis C-methylase UbiE